MSKQAILMSIRPQYVAKILNGEKTIEVRKKFPKDYVGWVYIYCTKGGENLTKLVHIGYEILNNFELKNATELGDVLDVLNGKVVAKFWCDKVEEIECISVGDSDYGSLYADTEYCTETLSEKELTQKSCVLPNEIFEYLDEDFDKVGYAIHISKLEVFEKPKELEDFKHWVEVWVYSGMDCPPYVDDELRSLYKAPQNWCYIYEEEHKKI